MRAGVIRFALFILLLIGSQSLQAQNCFYIESILVDACGEPEGQNEMVGIRTLLDPLNFNSMSVTWATTGNPWNGIVSNAQTASIVATLNQQVQDAGGCGTIIEPVNGIVPPNSKVILVTSYLMNPNFNSFGALAEDIYIVFHNSTLTTGHFANSGTGNRTLTISSNGCTDTLTYNRSLLVNQTGGNSADGGDGSTVFNYDNLGISYSNSGCAAPVDTLEFEAGDSVALCGQVSYTLNATINLVDNLQWTATQGSFSDPNAATTTISWPAGYTGVITVTLTGTNPCGDTLTDTLTITVEDNQPAAIIDDFSICNGEDVPVLPTTLTDGTTGTWSPAVISNTASGTYAFTPNASTCVAPATLTVTVTAQVDPVFDFSTSEAYCLNETPFLLPTTSNNGIAGTWAPAVISTADVGLFSYIFTPDDLSCTGIFDLKIVVSPIVTPEFDLPATYCNNGSFFTLPLTSNNGVTGSWSPSEIVDPLATTTYVFTPDVDQCALGYTYTFTVIEETAPDFPATYAVCSTDPPLVLPTTSPNGLVGTWELTNTDGLTSYYTFTPDAGQCAIAQTVSVVTTNALAPDFPATYNWCEISASLPLTLPTTSPNGVTGTWSPATVTAIGSYLFTPAAGQCALPHTLVVEDNGVTTPNFPTAMNLCPNASSFPALATTSPNGVTGTWSPSAISPSVTNYLFTPTGSCAETVELIVTWETVTVPNFPVVAYSVCYNGPVSISLAATSPNGVVGTWSPSVISNTTNGTYVFTPNAGQCATTFSLEVTIKDVLVPDFPTQLTYCEGDTPMLLPTTSPNGIAGSWSPAVISSTQSGTYVFTPVVPSEVCIFPFTLQVNIDPIRTPNFESRVYCYNQTPTPLATTSPNGITGTWSPATIVPNQTRTYTFTPTAGQCADPQTIEVEYLQFTAPDFPAIVRLCPGEIYTLPAQSPNGVSGSWSAAQADPFVDGTYTFTYGTDACPQTFTLQVLIYEVPLVDLGQHRLCINPETELPQSSISLQTFLSATNYVHTWYRNGEALPTTSNTLLVVTPGVYKVTYQHAVTGCQGEASTTVTASTPMNVTADAGPIMELIQTITVNVTGGSGNFLYQLDQGLWQSSPVFTNVREIGLHTITVRDLDGCEDVITPVQVITYPPFFTPNEDGFNDYWNISGLPYPLNSEIYIYDRYGKLLVVISPNGPGWDGNFHGKALPATDYWFRLNYLDFNQQKQTFRAHFSLKR